MISEAIGKILGMAMAYAVSALGLLLAYYNYRKRVVKAERVMSRTAWIVVIAILTAIGLAVLTVVQLAGTAAVEEAVQKAEPVVADSAPLEEAVPEPEEIQEPAYQRDTRKWPWVGIVLPASIFLLATWLTAALHHHFSHQGENRN